MSWFAPVLRFWRANPLVRLFVLHTLAGFAISALLMALILGFDLGGLRRLFAGAPWVVALLWFFSGLTFASVQMGIAVMSLAQGEQRFGGGERGKRGDKPAPRAPSKNKRPRSKERGRREKRLIAA